MSLCSHAETESSKGTDSTTTTTGKQDSGGAAGAQTGTPPVPRVVQAPRVAAAGDAEALLQRPATPQQLALFGRVVERVLSQNKKHLFALQLSHRHGRDTLAHVPNMDAPLVDRSGRLPAALVTPYDGMAAPPYAFEAYLARIAKYTRAAPVYYLIAFVYMDRIACTPRSVFRQRISETMPDASGLHARRGDPALDWWQDRVYLTQLNVHRMFLACFVVAVKYWSDHFFNNRAYGKVGGVRSEEMMSLELATLIWLDFRLGIDEAHFVPAPPPLPDADYSACLQRPAQLLPALVCPTLVGILRDTLAATPFAAPSTQPECTGALDEVLRVLHKCHPTGQQPADTVTNSSSGMHVAWEELINDKTPFSTLVELLSTPPFL